MGVDVWMEKMVKQPGQAEPTTSAACYFFTRFFKHNHARILTSLIRGREIILKFIFNTQLRTAKASYRDKII